MDNSPKSLTILQIKSVIQTFLDDIHDPQFFTTSEKKTIIKGVYQNAKKNNIRSKTVLYKELSKFHKELVAKGLA